MLFNHFHKGLNLGGWLSQYELLAEQPFTDANLEAHFRSFIIEEDIARIAAWGFDHIRLPVSGYLIYDRERGELARGPLTYIDQCAAWCRKHGLNIVLDLHDVWGNIYGAMDVPMPLLADPALREVFCRIWEQLAEYFAGVQEPIIMFELLNEVSDASGRLWNELWQEALLRIRRVDPSRPVLIGSNGQNSVAYLEQLAVVDDPQVFYNFHYYEPQVFTHQKAHFSEEMREFNHTVTYPGDISAFTGYLASHPEYRQKHALCGNESANDRALVEKLCGMAFRFQERTGRELYCGEFGVIDSAPPEEAVKWLGDLTALLNAHQIGHAMWNYKALDFGLLDKNGNVASQELLEAVVAGRAVKSQP